MAMSAVFQQLALSYLHLRPPQNRGHSVSDGVILRMLSEIFEYLACCKAAMIGSVVCIRTFTPRLGLHSQGSETFCSYFPPRFNSETCATISAAAHLCSATDGGLHSRWKNVADFLKLILIFFFCYFILLNDDTDAIDRRPVP